jgi:hypothetical protein
VHDTMTQSKSLLPLSPTPIYLRFIHGRADLIRDIKKIKMALVFNNMCISCLKRLEDKYLVE